MIDFKMYVNFQYILVVMLCHYMPKIDVVCLFLGLIFC